MSAPYRSRDVFVGSLQDFLNPPDVPPDTDDGYTEEEEAAYQAALDAVMADLDGAP